MPDTHASRNGFDYASEEEILNSAHGASIKVGIREAIISIATTDVDATFELLLPKNSVTDVVLVTFLDAMSVATVAGMDPDPTSATIAPTGSTIIFPAAATGSGQEGQLQILFSDGEAAAQSGTATQISVTIYYRRFGAPAAVYPEASVAARNSGQIKAI